MYNWHWLLILSLLQPIFSEHIVFDGRDRCCNFSSSPHTGKNDDTNLRLNIERETSKNERRDGELRRKDTHLAIERYLKRQILTSTDQSRSKSRTTEANGRRLHRTLRYVRTNPEICTSFDIREAHIKNFRVYDTPQVKSRTVSERIAENTDRIKRSFPRSVLNESITPKKDTERHIDRYQNAISETPRNEHEIFRNIESCFRDDDRQKKSASQRKQIEDKHITSSLDRSHKVHNRGTYQEDTRISDRNTKLRGQHIKPRIVMDNLQHREVLNRFRRQSDESRSRMEENINERLIRTDMRKKERDNTKRVAHTELDISKESSRRVTGGHSSQKREEQSRNLRSEQRNANNRERFLRKNLPANNNFPIQHELYRHNFFRGVEYNALRYERYRRDTANVGEAERYARIKKIAKSMDRALHSNSERLKDQYLTSTFKRNLSIHERDMSIGHNTHRSGERIETIQHERFIALDHTIQRHNIANTNGQNTGSREAESLIVRQKRGGSTNYVKVLESTPPLQNDKRVLVARFSRSREEFEANKYEDVRTNKLNTKNSVQCSRSFDELNTKERSSLYRNNSRYSKNESREKILIMEHVYPVNLKKMVITTRSLIKEKSDMIMDIDRNTNKINFERYARDNIRNSANAGKRDVRKQITRIITREVIRSKNKPINILRDHHRIIERRTSGEHKIREEYGNIRNYEQNFKHTERRVTLEPFLQQTDIRSTNRRIVQNREEFDTSEVRKNILNERKNRLSTDRFKSRMQTRNNMEYINRRHEVRNRENEYHRNTNRYIFSDASKRPILVKREINRIGLIQIDDTKVFQNCDAQNTNLNQERTRTMNMERSAVHEITYERISNSIYERRVTDEDHQLGNRNERVTIPRRNAREQRHTNIRNEEKRQSQEADLNVEFTRMKTEISRRNAKKIRDSIENRQRSTSDLNREFKKIDIDRDQSRRNIDFAYTRRNLTPTKAFSTDYKSIQNSSFFYWQYLFYALQGFYILLVFKQILHQNETNKRKNSFGWPCRRVMKVD